MRVGGVDLIPGETYTSESGIPALKSGKIIYTEDKVVILENVTLTTYEEKGMDCSVWPELTITLVGNNTIQGPTNGIYTVRSLNINGTGTLHISECTYGIDNNDMPLTITDAHIKTEGYRLGMRRAGMLHMEGCAILEARGGEGYESIGNISGIDGEGFCVTTPEGGKVKDNYVVDASDDIVKNSWVVIQKKIAINETTFPDANFRSHILAQTYGKDGYLTDEEITKITSLDLRSKGIASLRGLKYFTALTSLYIQGNQINETEMEHVVRELPTPEVNGTLRVKNLSGSGDENHINTVQAGVARRKNWNVWAMRNGTPTDLPYYQATIVATKINEETFPDTQFRNHILNNDYGYNYGDGSGYLTYEDIEGAKEIDVARERIKSLKGIEYFTALEELSCWENQLTDLDVSKNTKLRYLTSFANNLTALDVSNNTALELLNCSYNKLTTLDVSKNTALTDLSCYHNNIKGDDMVNLILGLPRNTSNHEHTFVVMNEVEDECNVCTKEQVAFVKALGWTTYCSSNQKLVPYEGSDPYKKGDVNEDGVVNVADIATVIDIMAANARRLKIED